MVRNMTLLCWLSLGPALLARAPLGINLAGIADWSTELVFVDQFRAARGWISQAKGQPWGKGGTLDLSPEGHLRSLKSDQFAETILWTDFGTTFPEGEFLCLYAGEGTIEFGGDARIKKSEPGRMVLEVKARTGMASLRITRTSPTNPIRDIRVLHPGHEANYRDKPFHPDLLKRWDGCKVVRFMDWQKTNNSTIAEWADRPTLTGHSQAIKGVCLELLIDFCNTTKMDPWFCLPHRATDDYVTQFARMVKARLAPDRKVHIEYSNECWNGQFEQARFCADQGTKLSLSANRYEAQLRFYARRSVEIFALFEKELGKDRLVRVLATQSANPWTGTTVLDWHKAHEKADAIAVAPYFGNRFGNPKTARTVAAMTVEQLLAELARDITANRKVLDTYARMARDRKLRLVAYEGGQHLAGHGGAENDEALTRLFHAANRHARMKDLYQQDYDQWNAVGGDLFVVFSSVGRFSKWGSWGQLESFTQKSSPKYQALRDYLSK